MTPEVAEFFHQAGGKRAAGNVQQPSGGKDAQNPRATTYLSRQLHRRRKAVSNCVPCIGKSAQELEPACSSLAACPHGDGTPEALLTSGEGLGHSAKVPHLDLRRNCRKPDKSEPARRICEGEQRSASVGGMQSERSDDLPGRERSRISNRSRRPRGLAVRVPPRAYLASFLVGMP